MEHLFMQIFDRKAWIESQLKHQIHSYGESLAYNLLADGKRPPPWIWNERIDGVDLPDTKALNREQLPSGISNPLPWAITPSANNSIYFTLPSFKADQVTQFSELTETFASNRYTCSGNSDRAVPNASTLYPSRKEELGVVEASAERDLSASIQHLVSRQGDMDNSFFEKAKTASSIGEQRSKEEHTGQSTRSRVSSVKAASVKETLDTSESLCRHKLDICRVTQSMSRLISHDDCLKKLPEPAKALNCDIPYKATECEPGPNSIPSENLDNIACAVDSTLHETFPRVEPKKLLFDCTAECGLIKNHENPSEMKCHGSSGFSLSKLHTMELAKEEVLPCTGPGKMHCSALGSSKDRRTEINKIINGVSEDVLVLLEQDNSISHSHSSSGHRSVHPDVCRKSLLDGLVNQGGEDQCSTQLQGPLKCGSGIACCLHEISTLIEPNHLEFHKESGSNISCVPASVSKFKAKSSVLGFTKKDALQSSSVKFSSDSHQALSPLANSPSHKHDLLPTPEVMTNTEGAHEVSGQVIESSKLSEVLESESVLHPTSTRKHLRRHSKPSLELLYGLSECAPTCSSSVTNCMLPSDVDFSCHENAMPGACKKESFRVQIECETGEQYTEQVMKETNTCSPQLINAPLNNGFLETDETETCTLQSVTRSALQANPTMVATGTENKMLDLQHSSRNSSCNRNISGSSKSIGSVVPSSNKATTCLSAQGTPCNGPTMKFEESTARKRSYDPATHSEEPKLRYFLRSSTSHQSLSSPQRNYSVSCSNKKSSLVQTVFNEICAGPKDVAENSIKCHMNTSNSTEPRNEQHTARYFLRSLDSRDNSTSGGTNYVGSWTESRKTIHDECEITWPKRRKIETKSKNIHGTPPRLRLKLFSQNQEDRNCRHYTNNSPQLGYDFILSLSEAEIGNPASKSALKMLNQSKRCYTVEDCPLKEDDQAVVIPLSVEHTQEEPHTDVGTKIILNKETRISELTSSELQKPYTSNGGHDSLLAHNTPVDEIRRSTFSSPKLFKDKENSDVDITLHMPDTLKFAHHNDDLVGCAENSPEFEGFSILPSITDNFVISGFSDFPSLQKERKSVLDKLCKTRNLLTPVSALSSKYKIHEVPDVYQSLPSGLLECMDFNCTHQFSDADVNHLRESVGDKIAGSCSNSGAHNDGSFLGRPYSHSLPSSSIRDDWEVRQPPLTPHIMKFGQKVVSGITAASSEKVGSNPELVCFRIDEDSTIANENEHVDRLECFEENLVSKENNNSQKRKALVDLTQEYQNTSKMLSDSKKFLDRGSLESVNSDSCVETQMGSLLSVGNGYASNIGDRENVDHSVNRNRVRKAAVSLRNRSSKPRISGKINERIRSQSTLEKGCKPTNIISNISSFIPLVQQKQKAAVALKGKKEIKVKALEAAEAAKRLEEKKQNEREMRKAAAKLERERLEQQNIRRAELKQKQKEEEKRKKEAEIAARKRQREEEGKKDKGRKKRCVEEARKRQKEQEEKSCAPKVEKELQHKASELKQLMKEMMEVGAKQQLKAEKVSGVTRCPVGTGVQLGASKLLAVATSSGGNTLQVPDDSNEPNDFVKVDGNSTGLQAANRKNISISEVNQDISSYEMTPYRDSDDEDCEDDIRRERKYIPPWARRECLEQIILSKQHLDPKRIFCQKRSFSLNEVLAPRIMR